MVSDCIILYKKIGVSGQSISRFELTHNILSRLLPLLCGGEAHALGPRKRWTENSKKVSFMLKDIFSLEGSIDK